MKICKLILHNNNFFILRIIPKNTCNIAAAGQRKPYIVSQKQKQQKWKKEDKKKRKNLNMQRFAPKCGRIEELLLS